MEFDHFVRKKNYISFVVKVDNFICFQLFGKDSFGDFLLGYNLFLLLFPYNNFFLFFVLGFFKSRQGVIFPLDFENAVIAIRILYVIFCMKIVSCFQVVSSPFMFSRLSGNRLVCWNVIVWFQHSRSLWRRSLWFRRLEMFL